MTAHGEEVGDPRNVTREEADSLFSNKTVELLDIEHDAEYVIAHNALGDTRCLTARVPPARVFQHPAATGNKQCHLIQLLEGQWTCQSESGVYAQRPGDVVLVGTDTPFLADHGTPARFVRWTLTTDALRPLLPDTDFPGSFCYLPAERGMTRVLGGTMRLMTDSAPLLDSIEQERLLTQFYGLVGHAVEAIEGWKRDTDQSYRAIQRSRILSLIETHAGDPDMSARSAARQLDISVRWLHVLLEDKKESFGQLLARRRVEKAARMLQDSRTRHLTIIEIAYRSGFNDLSTFYRTFREHYRTTPGEMRRSHPPLA